ncbi:uridine diphosphate-N-acetylglucosamine-binding protein YvcK, partial [bacterium]|nr:uridine diphosphate-N-acetylglucosamine-binding protein YvcK [bacterium]
MAEIKGIVFDLDDTLYDCTVHLREAAQRRAARAMLGAGLPLTLEEAYRLQIKLMEEHGPRFRTFARIADMYGRGNDFVTEVMRAYNEDEVGDISPLPDVTSTLVKLRSTGLKLFLVTSGVYARQEKKIGLLGLKNLFDRIIINDDDRGITKEECYIELMEESGLRAEELLSVGDRIHSEIKICNLLGMTTVQMVHGRFKNLAPSVELERPDFKIRSISELLTVLRAMKLRGKKRSLRVVAIGGGTGLPIVLEGMKNYSRDLTAIVTVTDSGRSSGRLRRDLGVLPSGDIRNCLIALSESEELLHELFNYRFDSGRLDGMSFGNLLIAAMAKVTGSFEQALKETSNILAISGKVFPSTLRDTHICARLRDGTLLEEEYNVRKPGKPEIEEVFLKPPDTEAFEEAVDEILSSDLLVLGPGSLYTSIIANLLISGIAQAIRKSAAKKIYVCNIVTQPGQTDGFDAARHVATIEKYLGEGVLDYVIINNSQPPPAILRRYEEDGAGFVRPEGYFGPVKPIYEDVMEDIEGKRILWEKQDLIRHNPDKLAKVLVEAL